MTNTALKGFLVDESVDELRLDVPGGTWLIPRADVERHSVWHNPPTLAARDGKPVEILVRTGATIGWLETVTIQALDRPMPLPDGYATVVGSETLAQESQDWGRTHGFAFDVSVSAEEGHTSVCCWDHPSGFGTVCQADDCM